ETLPPCGRPEPLLPGVTAFAAFLVNEDITLEMSASTLFIAPATSTFEAGSRSVRKAANCANAAFKAAGGSAFWKVRFLKAESSADKAREISSLRTGSMPAGLGLSSTTWGGPVLVDTSVA